MDAPVRARVVLALSLAFASLGGCKQPARSAQAEERATVPFELRRDSRDLTFFWFDEQVNAHAVSSIDEVPEARREHVRVDPTRPELRQAGFVYIADLRSAGEGGRYAVRAMYAEQFALLLRPQAPAETAPAGTNVPAGTNIVLYGASWCGACHQAAAWMRSQNIPFVEHDIEREPEAARELMARAAEQRVPTGSIPIISIRGRLSVGFDPNRILAGLRGT